MNTCEWRRKCFKTKSISIGVSPCRPNSLHLPRHSGLELYFLTLLPRYSPSLVAVSWAKCYLRGHPSLGWIPKNKYSASPPVARNPSPSLAPGSPFRVAFSRGALQAPRDHSLSVVARDLGRSAISQEIRAESVVTWGSRKESRGESKLLAERGCWRGRTKSGPLQRA